MASGAYTVNKDLIIIPSQSRRLSLVYRSLFEHWHEWSICRRKSSLIIVTNMEGSTEELGHGKDLVI